MKNKKQTIGDKIDETVNIYKDMYETLTRLGCKNPAQSVLTEAWINQTFVAEKVTENLNKLYEEEAKK